MKKTPILQLALLLGLASCSQSTDKSKDSSSKTTADSATSISTQAAIPLSAIKISKDEAQTFYTAYTSKVKARTLPHHKCSTVTDQLKYIRIPKGHIEAHLRIPEASFPESTSDYAGIRVYPFLDITGAYRYILCYTSFIGGDVNAHRDKEGSFYLISIPTDFDWCFLATSTHSFEKRSAHHSCEPDCPPLDQPLLSF